MIKLPQFQERFIPTEVAPVPSNLGQNLAQVAGIASQAQDIFKQRKLAKDMTKVNEMSTDFELQMQDEFNAFQQDRADNPEGAGKDFNNIIKERKAEFLEESGLGAEGRAAFARIAEGQRGSFGKKALNYEDSQLLNNFAESSERTAENNNLLAFRAGEDLSLEDLKNVDNSVKANVLAGSTFVSSDQLDNMINVQTNSAYKNWFDGAIETDPQHSLNLLESQKFDEKLGVDNLKSLMDKAKRRIEIKRKEDEKAVKEFAQLSRVSSALNGEILLDPKTTDDVKDVDFFWGFMNEQHNANNASPEERISDAKMITEKTGIIPAGVKTTSSAMLFNGDPSQQAMSAEFINDITNDKPRVSEQYDTKTKAFAQSISMNINAGVDQDTAVKWSRNSINDNLKAERNVRQKEYNGGKNAKLVQRDINKMESSLKPFFGDIEVGEDLISDFANLQENYFLNEGVDRETSFELAQKDIKNLYGVTEIGDKRYMKYAPENYYGKEVEENFGVKPDWIKKQVLDKVSKTEDRIFADDKEFKEFNKSISLEVNPDSTIGGQDPTYYIFSGNEFGGIDLMTDDNNQPLEYVPDFRATDEFRQLKKQQTEMKSREDIGEMLNEARREQNFKKTYLKQTGRATGGQT